MDSKNFIGINVGVFERDEHLMGEISKYKEISWRRMAKR